MIIDTLGLMSGEDLPVPEWQTSVHQPKLNEIARMGEETFFLAVSGLTIQKTTFIKDEKVLQSTSNFQIFMMVMNESKKELKDSVTLLLNLMFPQFTVIFSPKSLILNDFENDKSVLIDDKNFELLQYMCNTIFCINPNNSQNYNPKGKRAQEIADKIMKGRQRVQKQKAPEFKSILSRYVSCLAIGQQLSVYEILKYTLFQLYDQMSRFSLHVTWDLDMRARIAGAKGDKKVDDWMKDLH